MARAALDWSRKNLAGRTGLSVTTIRNIEHGDVVPREGNLNDIRSVFEQNGLEFTDHNGVRNRTDIVTIFEGDDAPEKLVDDIYLTLVRSDLKEVLITGVDESKVENRDKIRQHINRFVGAGITERLLSCEGDNTFIAPKNWYRWLPKNLFSTVAPAFIYADKYAIKLRSHKKVIIINDPGWSDYERSRFELMWQQAKKPK